MKKLFLPLVVFFCGVFTANAQNCTNVLLIKPAINGQTEVTACSGASVPLTAARAAIYREVGLYAGSRTSGSVNGTRQSASFSQPAGLAFDRAGNLYVADVRNSKIRKITPAGEVSTYAGTGIQGNTNGNRETATFTTPLSICSDTNGNLYVADYDACLIRKISTNGMVTTIAGDGTRGFADGSGSNARFSRPKSIVMGPDGFLYVSDSNNNRIRRISVQGEVTTYAGGSYAGFIDGSRLTARFSNTSHLIFDRNGNLLVSDEFNNAVRKITPEGIVSTLAGSGIRGYMDGVDSMARFNAPNGLAEDREGNIFVSDAFNHKIRVITKQKRVYTLTGAAQGYQTGLLSSALLNTPEGIVFDAEGALIISDKLNNCLRRISKQVVGTVLWNNGATTNEISITESGNYFYTQIVDGCTTQVSDTAHITITPTPTRPVIVAERRSFCLGEYADLYAPEGFRYLWSNGDTSRMIRTGVAGRYSVRTITGICTSESSEPVEIIINGPARPIININVSGPRPCLGTIAILRTTTPYDRYLWSNGDTTPTIVVNANGVYSVQGGNTQNCFSLASSNVVLEFDTAFCLLQVSRFGLDSLEANILADRYTWYLNGIELLSGNNGRRIAIQGLGTYSFKATIGGRTSTNSEPIIITDIVSKSNRNISVYPNPSEGSFTISGTQVTDNIQIYTLAGKLVKVILNKEYASTEVRGLAKGYYFAKISNANSVTTLKIQVK